MATARRARKLENQRLVNVVRNSLKITYDNVEFQKISGGNTPDPPLQGASTSTLHRDLHLCKSGPVMACDSAYDQAHVLVKKEFHQEEEKYFRSTRNLPTSSSSVLAKKTSAKLSVDTSAWLCMILV